MIQRANSVDYGLCACIWTENVRVTHRVAPQLHVCSRLLTTPINHARLGRYCVGELLDGSSFESSIWRLQVLGDRERRSEGVNGTVHGHYHNLCQIRIIKINNNYHHHTFCFLCCDYYVHK